MVTGQPLLIVWKICPSMSVRMKISLVSWIASTETDPKAGGESPPGTSSCFLHKLTRFILNQLKASLKHLTFKAVFLLALGSGKRRSEIHAWQSPAPLMVIGHPLLINWEIHPSTSARTKISFVSWIVSSETDPKAGVAYPPGTSHWPCTS